MSSTPRSANRSPSQTPTTTTSSSYLTYPVSHVVSGLYRRLTEPSSSPLIPRPQQQPISSHHHPHPHHPSDSDAAAAARTTTATTIATDLRDRNNTNDNIDNGSYTPPPHRNASPFQPPPLTPLTLSTTPTTTSSSSLPSSSSTSTILTRAVAEEIRLLIPPRLQLAEQWTLTYSLEEDGVSLGTLYGKCAAEAGPRDASFVLVVQDGVGGIFGAYLTSSPRPSSSYYGSGECFLWRVSVLPSSSLLSNLPPPPSAPDTESMGRSTTIASPTSHSFSSSSHLSPFSAADGGGSGGQTSDGNQPARASGTSTPDLIRFKAFPYSGVNDYLIFCQHDFLSVGGGDGKYGLWLDEVLEKGISSHCMTFGNEPLSEEGQKFEVVGAEVWCVGR